MLTLLQLWRGLSMHDMHPRCKWATMMLVWASHCPAAHTITCCGPTHIANTIWAASRKAHCGPPPWNHLLLKQCISFRNAPRMICLRVMGCSHFSNVHKTERSAAGTAVESSAQQGEYFQPQFRVQPAVSSANIVLFSTLGYRSPYYSCHEIEFGWQ